MELVTKDTSSKIQANDEVFGYAYNEGLVHQALVQYMANARSGNSAQKTRAEVSGGGKKPWRQKGTGRARAGTIRSPIWRKGGVTFASKPEFRNYTRKLNKKMYNRAIRSIISQLQRSDNLIVLSEFKCDAPRTKDFSAKMQALGIDSALIVLSEIGETEYLASRNLANFDVVDVQSIDPVSLLRFEKVVISAEAVSKLEELLK